MFRCWIVRWRRTTSDVDEDSNTINRAASTFYLQTVKNDCFSAIVGLGLNGAALGDLPQYCP